MTNSTIQEEKENVILAFFLWKKKKPGQYQALQTIAKPAVRLPQKKPAASDDKVATDPQNTNW